MSSGNRAFFTSCRLPSGDILIHGGLAEPDGRPRADAVLLRRGENPASFAPESFATPGPHRSHHAAALLEGNDSSDTVAVIGGWDGRRRTADVHLLDVASGRWTEAEVAVEGRPAGLSGHTATKVGGVCAGGFDCAPFDPV